MRIVREEPDRFGSVRTRLPRRLDEIPPESQIRTDFSHKFRTEFSARLRAGLSENLRSDPDLCEALARSEWDLDRLVLFSWRSMRLKAEFEAYSEELKRQTDWISEEAGAGQTPSLILIYRLVDSVREALEASLPALRTQFEKTWEWIDTQAQTAKIDEHGRTRSLLKGGVDALNSSSNWKKPAK